MAVVVDTALVPPESRFGLWAEVASRVYAPLAVGQLLPRPFAARLARFRLGPLSIDHMSADASVVRRLPAMIRGGDPEWVGLMLQLRGHCGVEQDDRAAVVGPGELVSWSSSRPYRIEAPGSYEVLIVHCPTVLLRPHADTICRRTAQNIRGDSGVGHLTKHHLLGLLRGLNDGSLPSSSHPHLAEAAIDLIRALHVRADVVPGAPVRSADLLRTQIKAFIDLNLADPDLGPDAIAGRHYVSRSYLDRLFESETATVQETIRAKRLDRARRDLTDRTLAAESILQIATRWGYRSAAHFSRSFRAAYQQSPSDFRREAQLRASREPSIRVP